MPDEFDSWPLEILHELGLTADMVRNHVIRPDHLEDAELRIELREAGDAGDPADPPPSGRFYRLDVEQLGRDLHALLSPCVAGYALQLRRYGQVIADQRFGFARTKADGGVDIPWAPDVQMHVASVSKLITAMAMTKLLHSRAIVPDARIEPWLPRHWQRGPGVAGITFRQLLTHQSGLFALNEAGPADYQFMKDQIAIGVKVVGKRYRNMNYGLCRILIGTIDAPYLFNPLGIGSSDRYWDLTTIRYYQRYVQQHVFDPVGVTSTLTHSSNHALAYPFPVTGPGWDSGDKSTMSGAIGWHLSIDDLLAVMAAFRRLGVIVDPTRAQTMLDREFGLDVKRDTALGRIYAKGGLWGSRDGRIVEQTNVFFLPKGMELAIVVNSEVCAPKPVPDPPLQERLLDTIEANIRVRWTAIGAAAAAGITLAALLRRTRARRRR